MKLLTYLAIFICKIIENALSTLRLIVVAKGKKVFGAILQFIIAFVWVITTGIVVTDVKEDPLKVIFFALGSLIGSYIGSLVEEKIALGNDMITIMVNNDSSEKILQNLSGKYFISKIDGKNDNKYISILLVIIEKKKRKEVLEIIKNIDKAAIITIESIKNISYNHTT